MTSRIVGVHWHRWCQPAAGRRDGAQHLLVTLAGCLLWVGLHSAIAAVPADLSIAGYEVFEADDNGDGCTDYLLKAPDLIIPLSIDDDAPLILPVPSRHAAMILISSPGCSYSLVQSPPRSQVQKSSWIKTTYPLVVGDARGDGGGSLMLLVPGAAGRTFNIGRHSTTKDFTLLQVLNTADITSSAPGAVVSLEYTNGDSRSDLVVRSAGEIVAVYTANDGGTYVLGGGGGDAAAIVRVVWGDFASALVRNSAASALNLVSAQNRSRFAAVMNDVDADLPGFANSIESFEILTVESVYIEAAIVVRSGTQRTAYFVAFGKDASGRWKIFNM